MERSTIVILILLFFFLLLIILTFGGNYMLFCPDRHFTRQKELDHWITQNGNGFHIKWWKFYDDAPTIFYCHGNGGNISERPELVQLSYVLRTNLVLFDYYGFGASSGAWPQIHQMILNADAVYQYVTKQVDKSNIMIFGESLGGYPAAFLAGKYHPSYLVLLSTFDDFSSIFSKYSRLAMDASKLIFPSMINSTFISKLDIPIAIIHSKEDELIPYSSATELYNSLDTKRKIFITTKGSHRHPKITQTQFDSLAYFLHLPRPASISGLLFSIQQE